MLIGVEVLLKADNQSGNAPIVTVLPKAGLRISDLVKSAWQRRGTALVTPAQYSGSLLLANFEESRIAIIVLEEAKGVNKYRYLFYPVNELFVAMPSRIATDHGIILGEMFRGSASGSAGMNRGKGGGWLRISGNVFQAEGTSNQFGQGPNERAQDAFAKLFLTVREEAAVLARNLGMMSIVDLFDKIKNG